MPCPPRSGRDPPGLGAMLSSCPHPARRPLPLQSGLSASCIRRLARRRTRHAAEESQPQRCTSRRGGYLPGGCLTRRLDEPAIAGTCIPDADATVIIARRTRIDSGLPRGTICSSLGPRPRSAAAPAPAEPPAPPTSKRSPRRRQCAARPRRPDIDRRVTRPGERFWSPH
jgi:hypothetical protein